ncbi:putative virion structural protein [Pseudomonas phage OBP]|uniref:putative virion structural protein n=1 Tax=Pseudomonas phage OBP TaxID=1124849 RepID=UPI000240D5E4|nr:putative virion structural protein [Pseudomonas phage OBP]AEV89440.1 putative virion structural protein [Pseudomonas phage OBP]
MIINGYDTTVGSRFKVKDKVSETLKILQSTDRLDKVDNRGVFAIDQKNDFGLPPFVFPISVFNYVREPITIIDQRTYFNSQGRNINVPEYNVMLLAATLQQDLQRGNLNLVKSVRPYTIKAFANAVGNAIARAVTLDILQKIQLRVILAHYFVCLAENPNVDYMFISQNAVSRALGLQQSQVQEVIQDLGYLGSLDDLLKAIKSHPSLFALSRLDMGGLVAAGSSVFFSTSGFKMLMGAALEMPTLFTAICWGAATQKIYQNTAVGQELNVKTDKKVENFIATVEYYFNGK